MATELRRVRVDDLVNSDLRPYRLPMLARLARSDKVIVTVWHGNAAIGVGAPTNRPTVLPIPDRPIHNVFWPKGGQRVIWQRGALSTLRSDSEVIVCAEVIHNLTVWVIALTHRLFGKRLVLRGFFYRPRRNSHLSRLLRHILHGRANAYIAYTERGRADLLTEGTSADRVFVSQNTLDTERLARLARQVDDASVEDLRTRLGLTQRRVLLYLGRLLPVKGVGTAIAALNDIDDACLIVIGDGHLREQLEEEAAGLPVHFVGAIYDETDLAPFFRLADLLVLPGRVGLTCVHGFANGVPCVTTTETAVEQSPEYEYIVSDFNGLILPDQRPETWSAAVKDLLDDADRLARLGQGASETATRLGMETMVRRYEDAVLRSLSI